MQSDNQKKPYEKPQAIFVALRPEERLMQCGKCPGASHTPACGDKKHS
jgi:hypothetical protein